MSLLPFSIRGVCNNAVTRLLFDQSNAYTGVLTDLTLSVLHFTDAQGTPPFTPSAQAGGKVSLRL